MGASDGGSIRRDADALHIPVRSIGGMPKVGGSPRIEKCRLYAGRDGYRQGRSTGLRLNHRIDFRPHIDPLLRHVIIEPYRIITALKEWFLRRENVVRIKKPI